MLKSFSFAGLFTIASFVASLPTAEAAIELSPVVITQEPISACTEFSVDGTTLTASCFDDGNYYDAEHYMVLADCDYPWTFYLGVWQ